MPLPIVSSDRRVLQGSCALFRIQLFEAPGAPLDRNTLMFFEGGVSDLQCTVCLRGGDAAELARVKRVFQLATHIGYNLGLESAYLFDVHATYLTSSLPLRVQQAEQLQDSLSGSSASRDVEQSSTALVPHALWSSSPFIPCLDSDAGSLWNEPIQALEYAHWRLRDQESKNMDAPWLRQSLLLTICWLSSEGQCFPPQLTDVQFYTSSDKTLGTPLLAFFKNQLID